MSKETFNPDNLTVSGPMPEATEIVVIKQGEKITRGTLIGKDAEAGEYVASIDGGVAGTRIAYEDVDASEVAVEAVAFKGGNFNFYAMETGGQTADAISDTLWHENIHIETNIGRA